MSREVRRVPLDFAWPYRTVWSLYLMPERLHGDDCPGGCEGGGSPRVQELHNLWYGNIPFRPEDNGSTPLTAWDGGVRAYAERNVTRDEGAQRFYVGDNRDEYFVQAAIEREAQRLADLWNGQWQHHLNQADVDALLAGGRLMDFTHRVVKGEGWKPIEPPPAPTAEQVNAWSLHGFGHDAINSWVVIKARCEREGEPTSCATCGGVGSVEAYPGQRAERDAWKPEEPPTGEGWQLWETVSEGSPVSPVFATDEELARWLTTEDGGKEAGPSRRPLTISQARGFVAAGWAPTGMSDAGGYHDGVEFVASQSVLDELEVD